MLGRVVNSPRAVTSRVSTGKLQLIIMLTVLLK